MELWAVKYCQAHLYLHERGSNMYLRKNVRPDGRTHLAICKSYRDPVTKKNRQKVVMKIGYLEEQYDKYDDPIAYFEKLAEDMTREEQRTAESTVTVNHQAVLSDKTDKLKNIGFAAFSKIYHELGIDQFYINRERGMKARLPLNNIMKLLVYERIFNPSSKLSAYANKDFYVENFEFPLESVYRALRLFAKHKNSLLLDLHENVRMRYGRDVSNVFYDVTNYYFHTEEETNLIAKGFSKDRRGKPIIQMGLLLDKAGMPITYELFRGNTSDCETLLPILSKLKKDFRLKRAIVVADKGLNTGDNKAYNILKGDGYIFSRSLRGKKADKDVKAYALREEGYVWINDEFKIKSRIYPTDIWVTNKDGKRVSVTIDEKHIVFYSEDYARRTRHKRNEQIAKAITLIHSPSKYAKAENYGALKYIIGMRLDKKTGELTLETKRSIPVLDEELIREEEKLDGYYSIVTSELDMPDSEVIETYQGLWKIEESFKLTKSLLKARPVYLKRDDHIDAHFLTCFIALLLLRVLEMKTHKQYSPEKMINSLKKANVVWMNQNIYQAIYYDDILKLIDEKLNLTLNKEYPTQSDLKKLIAETK